MYKRSLYLVAILVSLIWTPSVAQSLWQKTRIGMSPAEVHALYPDAMGPAKEGTPQTMIEKNVDIFSEKFKATFWFDNSRLNRVTIDAGSKCHLMPDVFGPCLKMPLVEFRLISDELTKKYGKPVKDDEFNRFRTHFHETDFLNGNTSIRLSYNDTTLLSASGDISIIIEYTDNRSTTDAPL